MLSISHWVKLYVIQEKKNKKKLRFLIICVACIEGSIRNQPFVWRLGVPSKDEKIQLWEDQLGKASKHLFIKFRARPYEFHEKRFVLQEESFTILLDECLSMGPRPSGKSEIMTDGAGIISRAAATRVCESLGRKYDTLPCKSIPFTRFNLSI
jgi:hypothetical protein